MVSHKCKISPQICPSFGHGMSTSERFLLMSWKYIFVALIMALVFTNFVFWHTDRRTIDVDGEIREYLLFEPSSRQAGAPLIVVLHAFSSNASWIRDLAGFDTFAERDGVFVAYPEGSKTTDGKSHWNASLEYSDVNDVEFLRLLAARLQAEFNLDPRQTFIVGVSNGGFMAYSMMCRAPGVFAAAANVIGTISGEDWRNCAPRPHVLDPSYPWQSGQRRSNRWHDVNAWRVERRAENRGFDALLGIRE